jgi:outer membrane protein TolC
MERVRETLFTKRSAARHLTGLCAASLLCVLGCSHLTGSSPDSSAPIIRGTADNPAEAPRAQLAAPRPVPETAVRQAVAQRPANSPLTELPAPRATEEPVIVPEAPTKVLLINLDTVLRLAQDQNVQVNLAREKLQEAYADKDLADKSWLPSLEVGPSYYRHEGGIQDEEGNLVRSSFGSFFAGLELHARLDLRETVYRKVDAERKVWQQKGELSRMTSENLLDAAGTYIDLLSARAAEAVSLEVQGNLAKLLELAKKRAATDPGSRVEVEGVATEISAQQQLLRKVREGAIKASAKLAYLLGLDPCTELLPLEPQLVPLRLVDPNQPTCDLVNKALASGPGVREMEGLLALIQSAMDKARGPGRLMPAFDVRLAEGAFGTGPGDQMSWDNRLDLGLHARWNLTGLATARERQRLAQSKLAQAQLGYQDLRGRLTMGVQEARESSLSSSEQRRLAEEQIGHARSAYKISENRLTVLVGPNKASISEVLMAVRVLGGAQLNYLSAVRDFNKAQLRLMVLLGGADGGACPRESQRGLRAAGLVPVGRRGPAPRYAC